MDTSSNKDKMMYDISQMKPEDKLLLKQILDNDISTDARINNLGTKVDGLRMDLIDLSRDMREYVRKYVDMTKEQQAKGLMEYLNEKTEQDATLKKIEDMKEEAVKKEDEESNKSFTGGLFSSAVGGLKNTFSGVNDMLNDASGTLSKMANDAVGNNVEEEDSPSELPPEETVGRSPEDLVEQSPEDLVEQSPEDLVEQSQTNNGSENDILDEIEKNVIEANDHQMRSNPKVMSGGGLPKTVNEWINTYSNKQSKSSGKKK